MAQSKAFVVQVMHNMIDQIHGVWPDAQGDEVAMCLCMMIIDICDDTGMSNELYNSYVKSVTKAVMEAK